MLSHNLMWLPNLLLYFHFPKQNESIRFDTFLRCSLLYFCPSQLQQYYHLFLNSLFVVHRCIVFKPGVRGWRTPGFLKLFCVCLPLRLFTYNLQCDMGFDWLNKLNSCDMATVVGIINGRDLGINMHCGN